MNVFWSPLYRDAISPEARFPRERYQKVYDEIRVRDTENAITIHSPRLATRDELARVHDRDYVDAFLDNRLERREIIRIGFRPWLPSFQERTLRLAGASLQALDCIGRGEPVAGNLGGGTHHAFRAHGEGYCVFNDLALCARLARDELGARSVLILDLDVHQGNGTAALLHDEPDLFTYSIHGAKNYPFRKQESNLDIELEDGSGDTRFLEALDATLPEVFRRRRPELVLYQAGVDALAEDRLGKLAMTRAGIAARNERVFDLCSEVGAPVVVFMGGGYAEPIERSVEAHADTFLYASHYSL
ncbi:MAG: histone deacetylase [Myxococcota bacterium]